MIEMIWGSAGWRYVAQGSDGGVESMSSWSFDVSAPAVGMGFPYGFGSVIKSPNPAFSDPPTISIFSPFG